MKIQSLLFLILSTLFPNSLYSHGFCISTPIKRSDKAWSIGQIYKNSQKQKLWVSSFDLRSQSIGSYDITRVGKSQTNCYIRVIFDDNKNNDILCTPSQELFLFSQQQFMPACKLQIGDGLLSVYKGLVIIKSIQLIEQPLKVYALEVSKTHNFFVGNYGILAHNMFFPELMNLSAFLSSGATVGGLTGGCFGPITLAGGVAIGGVIGIIAKIFSDKVRSKYFLDFNIDKVAAQLKLHKSERENSNSCTSIGPEDPDEWKKHPHGKYEDAPYHHPNSKGSKNRSPKNGQAALDNSFQIKETALHRIGISNGEFVVLRRTSPGLYHGYACEWSDLTDDMQRILRQAKWVSKYGKILV